MNTNLLNITPLIFFKKHSTIIVFFLLLLIGFLVRINNYFSIAYTEDGARDYLVANHIVKYGELPLTGPIDATFLKSSPFYYYFLASFLLIENNYAFLGFINIILQLVTVGIVYFLAKKMFDAPTALIAAVLFGFSEAVLYQSKFIWQPWILEPFINLSLLLLYIAYAKKAYSILLLSTVVFILSLLIHKSSLAMLPVFLISAIYILHKIKGPSWRYVGLLIPVSIFLLAHIPLFLHNGVHNMVTLSFASLFNLLLLQDRLIFWFTGNIFLFLNSFFPGSDAPTTQFNIAVLLIIALTFFYLHLLKGSQKRNFLILIIFLLQPLLFASFFKFQEFRYFVPAFGLFAIFSAVLINALPIKKAWGVGLKFIIVLIVLGILSPQLPTYLKQTATMVLHQQVPYVAQHMSAYAIEKEVKSTIKAETGSFLSFDIVTIKSHGPYHPINASFWNILEKGLNTQLTVLDDSSPLNYRPFVNEKKFIFLNCYHFRNAAEEYSKCLNVFFAENSEYKLIKNIYSRQPFSIYITYKE